MTGIILSIAVIVQRRARGEESSVAGRIDSMQNVMPSADPGEEQIQALRESVDKYLQIVSDLPSLRKTATARHPIFGHLTAHGWHCMFGLHLEIHHKQVQAVRQAIAKGKGLHDRAMP